MDTKRDSIFSDIKRGTAWRAPIRRYNQNTTNPIESTFATVRLRTNKTKGCGSRTACLTMVFKLAQCAENHWRMLNGSPLLNEVIRGVKFVDGIKEIAA